MAVISPQDELLDLLGSLCNGSITGEEQESLGRRLNEDPAARRLNLKYLDLQLSLMDLDINTQNDSRDIPESLLADLDSVDNDDLSVIRQQEWNPPPRLAHQRLSRHGGFFLPGNSLRHPRYHDNHGRGRRNWLAYSPRVLHAVSWKSSPSADRSYAAVDAADKARAAAAKEQKDVQWVGRITGMVDCKWSADKDFLPPGGDYVSLGRKYKLDSGLMEITYYTGAKVILQGPCTYEVDSAVGGYLSLGKLTARVEKRGRENTKTNRRWMRKIRLPPSAFRPLPAPSP